MKLKEIFNRKKAKLTNNNDLGKDSTIEEDNKRTRELTGFWKFITVVFTIIFVFLTINEVFDLRFFIGKLLFTYSYYYFLLAFCFSQVFLRYPFKKITDDKVKAKKIFKIDIALFIVATILGIYFGINGKNIVGSGWSRVCKPVPTVAAFMMWALLIEAVRRLAGNTLAIVVFVFSIFPIFADKMPPILLGGRQSLLVTARHHIYSNDSAMGLLVSTFAKIIAGFSLFGVTISWSGGGEFFLDLATSVFGGMRGGTAKVSIVSSALFGSLAGQPVANVITTGVVTIPAMKKSGYSSEYAAAVESLASTGSSLTPPIMGASGFVMASFLGIPYMNVALAAGVPALLFYLSLMINVDSYAALNGLKGLKKDERPDFWSTLKEGWHFLIGIGVLLYVLFNLRLLSQSSYYATFSLILLAQLKKKTRFNFKKLVDYIDGVGESLSYLFGLLVAVGMILGALSVTGVNISFARELVKLSGGSVFFILIFSAIAALFMGMGMSAIAVYVTLSIVVVPALVTLGLNELAVHLFVLYYGLMSYITPPVALATFPAAQIAKTSAIKVGMKSAYMGIVLYLLPFLFVLSPELVLQGETGAILFTLAKVSICVFIISSAMGGYMIGIGKLWSKTAISEALKWGLIVATIILALPLKSIFIFGALSVFIIIMVIIIINSRRQREGLKPIY